MLTWILHSIGTECVMQQNVKVVVCSPGFQGLSLACMPHAHSLPRGQADGHPDQHEYWTTSTREEFSYVVAGAHLKIEMNNVCSL